MTSHSTHLFTSSVMDRLCPYTHVDLTLDQTISYAKLAEDLIPIKTGYSLHVWCNTYEINNKLIEIGGDLSTGELFGCELIKNDWSKLNVVES